MSFYDSAVPAYLQMLTSLSASLKKAEAYAGARKISRLPIDPRFARMLIEAERTGVLPDVLAIGLSAVLWTVTARTVPVPVHEVVAMSAAASDAVSADSPTPLDSDLQWRAAHDAIGPITESVWKTSPVHAALAATRAPHFFDPILTVSAPDPPAAKAAPYLRHTPLLI